MRTGLMSMCSSMLSKTVFDERNQLRVRSCLAYGVNASLSSSSDSYLYRPNVSSAHDSTTSSSVSMSAGTKPCPSLSVLHTIESLMLNHCSGSHAYHCRRKYYQSDQCTTKRWQSVIATIVSSVSPISRILSSKPTDSVIYSPKNHAMLSVVTAERMS